MHIRTFKAQAAKKFCKANPGWTVGADFLAANRSKTPAGAEALVWGVMVTRGRETRRVWLQWSEANGFWMVGGHSPSSELVTRMAAAVGR